MAVPVGQALGYGYGGFMCSALDPVQIGFAGVNIYTYTYIIQMAAMLRICILI
jgi:hypothetical protein